MSYQVEGALLRNSEGLCERSTVLRRDDIYYTDDGERLERIGVTEVLGWGPDYDGPGIELALPGCPWVLIVRDTED